MTAKIIGISVCAFSVLTLALSASAQGGSNNYNVQNSTSNYSVQSSSPSASGQSQKTQAQPTQQNKQANDKQAAAAKKTNELAERMAKALSQPK